MFLNQRGEERKRLVVFINVSVNFKFVINIFCTVFVLFLSQSDVDQETEKDDAPASPVSPSGRLYFFHVMFFLFIVSDFILNVS